MHPGAPVSPPQPLDTPGAAVLAGAGRGRRVICAYGQGLLVQPLLGLHDATNLERVHQRWRQ